MVAGRTADRRNLREGKRRQQLVDRAPRHIDVATGAMHDLLAPAFQINDPQWSPDGKEIAIIGGIMSDFGATGGDVYLVDAQSGASRDVTDGAAVSAQSLRWNDATSLDVVAHVSGAMHLVRLDIATGRVTALTDRDESLWSWSSARGGAIVALVRSVVLRSAGGLGGPTCRAATDSPAAMRARRV